MHSNCRSWFAAKGIRFGRILKIFLLAICLFFSAALSHLSAASREYEIKAAFLYNFIKFVDWPSGTFTTNNSPVTIAIVGNDPFEDALDRAIAGKTVGDHGIIIKRVGAFRKGLDLTKYQVVFISSSEAENLNDILQALRSAPVLTVGDMDQFVQRGGIINLTISDNKIRFEVSTKSAEKAQLSLSSKILKLAVLVNN